MIYEAVLGGDDEEVLVGSVAGGGRWALKLSKVWLKVAGCRFNYINLFCYTYLPFLHFLFSNDECGWR